MPDQKFYITGHNQTRTVTPSNIQQTITPQAGFNALDAVVVNPIAAAMPENLEKFVMRNNTLEPFALSLSGDIPTHACYYQNNLVAVYGEIASVESFAFCNCSLLQEINLTNCASIGDYGFSSTNLKNITCHGNLISSYCFSQCAILESADIRNVQTLGLRCFQADRNLKYVDLRNFTGNIIDRTFEDCPLKILDLTHTVSAGLSTTNAMNNTAYLSILVEDDTAKAYYQSATNWSTFASKIKTVAEFETEIGMTYDEYYLQVFGHPRNEVAA